MYSSSTSGELSEQIAEYNRLQWKAASLGIGDDLPELFAAVEQAMRGFSEILKPLLEQFEEAMAEIAERIAAVLKDFVIVVEKDDWLKIKYALRDRTWRLVPMNHKPIVKMGKMYKYNHF